MGTEAGQERIGKLEAKIDALWDKIMDMASNLAVMTANLENLTRNLDDVKRDVDEIKASLAITMSPMTFSSLWAGISTMNRDSGS